MAKTKCLHQTSLYRTYFLNEDDTNIIFSVDIKTPQNSRAKSKTIIGGSERNWNGNFSVNLGPARNLNEKIFTIYTEVWDVDPKSNQAEISYSAKGGEIDISYCMDFDVDQEGGVIIFTATFPLKINEN